jgi:hypothetical protein
LKRLTVNPKNPIAELTTRDIQDAVRDIVAISSNALSMSPSVFAHTAPGGMPAPVLPGGINRGQSGDYKNRRSASMIATAAAAEKNAEKVPA